jgi:hypothetical protein
MRVVDGLVLIHGLVWLGCASHPDDGDLFGSRGGMGGLGGNAGAIGGGTNAGGGSGAIPGGAPNAGGTAPSGGAPSSGGVPNAGGAPGGSGGTNGINPSCAGIDAGCTSDAACCNGRCGAGKDSDDKDCTADGFCVGCRTDLECPTGRCDGCACLGQLDFGSACNEDSDCTSGDCGPPGKADPKDCAVDGHCAECFTDSQCASGRCDGCACVPALPADSACNEASDCLSGDCSSGKCNGP